MVVSGNEHDVMESVGCVWNADSQRIGSCIDKDGGVNGNRIVRGDSGPLWQPRPAFSQTFNDFKVRIVAMRKVIPLATAFAVVVTT
jgi:hypothetical protein